MRFDVGVPTTSVMDMAIQARENDLVLGTHGRSAYVVDDYSALRGLRPADFSKRLEIRSVTPGQQYEAGQTPSTRFPGSGEFRADNEPYGVMLTFMAAGDDLAHPDPEHERTRRLERADADDNGKPVKIELTVRDAEGAVIRKQKLPVHQGVNRLTWNLRRDGVRPMPGPQAPSIEDGLPAGPEVLPGRYRIELRLPGADGEAAEAVAEATVLADPRSAVGSEARTGNHQTLLALLELQESAVAAVEQITRSRADLDTASGWIGERLKAAEAEDEALESLKSRAKELDERLTELEERFRTPPRTRGAVYDDDRVVSRIGAAYYYVASTADAPTDTALEYVAIAERSLAEARTALEVFMNEELAPFSRALSDAGIGLFAAAQGDNRE